MKLAHTLSLAALVFLTACDTTAPVIREAVPFRVLSTSDLFEPFIYQDGGDSEVVPAVSVALTSEAEEAAFLASYPRRQYWVDGTDLVVPFPDVDYATTTALVVALGTTGSGSISVRLDSVIAGGSRSVAYTTKVSPCIGTRDVVNPSVVGVVDGPSREVTFAPTATERRSCQF